MKLKIMKLTTLDKLPNGSLFLSKDKTCLGMKSVYRTDNGAIEAFIVGRGDMFWGGVSNPTQQNELEVWEVKVKKLDSL